ncbi:hypothetical protein LXL04_010300 [Taraxacum kok-saghyz]
MVSGIPKSAPPFTSDTNSSSIPAFFSVVTTKSAHPRSFNGADFLKSKPSLCGFPSLLLLLRSRIPPSRTKYGLDDNTVDFIEHALALYRADSYLDQPAIDFIKRVKVAVCRIISKVCRRFSIYLPPLWTRRITSGFARLSAVYGGTYMLNGFRGIRQPKCLIWYWNSDNRHFLSKRFSLEIGSRQVIGFVRSFILIVGVLLCLRILGGNIFSISDGNFGGIFVKMEGTVFTGSQGAAEIRDYIHVMGLADGHVAALKKLFTKQYIVADVVMWMLYSKWSLPLRKHLERFCDILLQNRNFLQNVGVYHA